MSIVSVSLRASLPQVGHFTCINSADVSSGLPLPNTISLGSSTGKSFCGTGIVPHSSQWIIGIGVPQYLCLEINQGLIFQFSFLLPLLILISAINLTISKENVNYLKYRFIIFLLGIFAIVISESSLGFIDDIFLKKVSFLENIDT